MQVKTLKKVSRGEEVLVMCDQGRSLTALTDDTSSACPQCAPYQISPHDIVSVDLNN